MRKFSPTYNPNLVNSLDGTSRDVYFANADPGTGKTYSSLELAVQHFTTGNCILAYAAPTNLLLRQFEDEFKAAIKIKYGKKSATLLDKYYARIDAERLPPGVSVRDAFAHLTVGSKKHNVDPLPDGSVLLLTHQCLERLDDNIGKDRVSLIYDEARQCLVGEHQINVPLHLLDYLFVQKKYMVKTPFYRAPVGDILKDKTIDTSDSILIPDRMKLDELRDEAEYFDYSDVQHELDDCYTARYRVRDVYLWKWNPEIPLRKLNGSVIREVWRNTKEGKNVTSEKKLNEHQVRAFIEILRQTQNDSFDVYVDMKSADNPKRKGSVVKINIISSPSRMFQGFGKVLVLSAFFSFSQMYYILNNDPDIELVDVTNKVIDRRRRFAMFKRMERCYVSYVFHTESLAKKHLLRSIVALAKYDPKTKLHTFKDVQFFNQRWREAFFQDNPSANNFGNKQPPHYRDFLNSLNCDIDKRYRPKMDQQLEVLSSLKYSKESVVRFMVRRALDIQKIFNKLVEQKLEKDYSKEFMPITINSTLNDPADLRKRIPNLWKHEHLDKFKSIEQVPSDNRGLNTWKTRHSIAFLATMKHGNGEVEFLKKVIPRYRPDVDRTLDFCIQSIFRCNMRDPLSPDPCMVVVSDQTLANELAKRISNLRVIAPCELDENFKVGALFTYAEPEERKKEREKINAKARKGVQTSEITKEVRRINSQLNYWRKQLSVPNNKKDVAAKIKQLEEARAKLKLPTQTELRSSLTRDNK